MADTSLMDKLVSLCKRRGFVFQSSEIYGGLGSVWDYGPLGVELKKNVKDRWWNAMVHAREDIEGLDAAILMHPKVWEASGHVAGFTDPLVDCRHCKNRFRADDPRIKGTPGQPDAQCPACGTRGSLTEPRMFNLMFKTFMGPVEDSAAVVYLRPETAQGIYVNYLNVLQSSRQRIPFGIAQIGKAFRNEITPGNFIFRTREFEQMEMQFFVQPGTDSEWFEKWREWRMPNSSGISMPEASLPTTPEPPLTSSTSFPLAGRRSKAFTIGETSTSAGTRSIPERSWNTSTRPGISDTFPISWRPPPALTGLR
jgi:glycyl-tRNA synthetase